MEQQSPFVWHELMVPNPSSAPSFYKSITGWSTQPFQSDYTLWVNGESPIGGLAELPKELMSNGVPPHWLHYVGVEDVDATTRRAEELGGHVNVPPTDIPDAGRFAVLADPQGAVFAIYKSNQENAAAGAPKFGEFSWHELGTTDREAAWEFYSNLFGWKETSTMDMGEGNLYQMFAANGGEPTGGLYKMSKEMEGMPPHWMGYVLVPDVDDAVAAVKSGGGQVVTGPMEIPGGRVAVFTDPQGAAFAAHENTTG
jgi:hypothetical protein